MSAVAKNLGGQVKAYDDNFGKMPFDLQIGVSKTFAALPVRVSATLVDLTHYDYRFINHLNLGAEILLSGKSMGRAVATISVRGNDMKVGSWRR